LLFFFQAEDGIRDDLVTGVQTCALPIYFIKVPSFIKVGSGLWRPRTLRLDVEKTRAIRAATILKAAELFKPDVFLVDYTPTGVRSEERRVGRECQCRR